MAKVIWRRRHRILLLPHAVGKIGPPSNTMFHVTTKVSPPKRDLDPFSCFYRAQPGERVTDTYATGSSIAIVRTSCIRCSLIMHTVLYWYAFVERRDYCLHETFNATCRAGTVLLMTSAVYGRMRIGRCIDGDFNIGCATDVLRYFDSQCTARQSCEVDVRNLVDLHPCQRDFMSYLEASYRCVRSTTNADYYLRACCEPVLFVAASVSAFVGL